jgi:YggT family protein
MSILVQAVSTFLSIYTVLLIIRILLSWFPNVDWFNPPFSVLSQLTDPYLNLFRAFIPPLGASIYPPLSLFYFFPCCVRALERSPWWPQLLPTFESSALIRYRL